MSDIKITGLGSGSQLPELAKPGGSPSGAAFDEIIQEAMGKLGRIQQEASQATQELASGGDVTQAIIAMEKADMNFQLMVEVRNKLLAAYEEIMRMQV